MITSSSIPYISRMLNEPQYISEADSESIQALTETYPYFVPARYMEAAEKHKQEPYSSPMMSMMQLYMGNWLLYCQFLKNALGGEEVPFGEATVAEQPVTAVPEPEAEMTMEEEAPVEEEQPAEEEMQPVAKEYGHEEEEVAAADDLDELAVFTAPANDSKKEINADDFVPQNIDFVRPKRQHPVQGDEEELVPEPQPQKKPVKESRTVSFTEQLARDEKDDNLIPPIYTEDYFLHQGIQVSNKIPDDMGGNIPEVTEFEKSLMVVMSFADWLKYYKKKKQEEQEDEQGQRELKTMWQREKLAAALEEENDEIPENVFEMAVNSITKEESLVSESLAEVYVKQGRYDKAIDMYKKLSLRKPQKKAYFARKIEQILK